MLYPVPSKSSQPQPATPGPFPARIRPSHHGLFLVPPPSAPVHPNSSPPHAETIPGLFSYPALIALILGSAAALLAIKL